MFKLFLLHRFICFNYLFTFILRICVRSCCFPRVSVVLHILIVFTRVLHALHIGLHIFQELLMIFTAGMKYLFSKDEKLDITMLTKEDIQLISQYFESFGFTVSVQKFTISEYLDNMITPNYFLKQELIEENTPLRLFYYETHLNENIYRVQFDFLRV